MATTIVTKSGSGAPTASDLVAGELAVDLTNKRLYTEDSGGTVLELGTNPSGNITFGDNGKAIFGAGSDLQIYHDSNNSYIKDAGTGNLYINANELRIGNADNSKDYIHGNNGAEVKLYYNNALKLATTATGIDVTGSVTASGTLNFGTLWGASSPIINLRENGNSKIQLGSSAGYGLRVAAPSDATDALSVGTLSITDGTTYSELFKVSSAGNVGIGVVPTAPLDVRSSAASGIVAELHNNVGYGIDIGSSTADAYISSGYQQNFIFKTNAGSGQVERMRIDSSGNLLVSKSASDGGVAGHELRAGSFAIHTRDNGPALYARRIGSGTNDEGPIQVFENADGQVGTIGATNSFFVGQGDSGLGFFATDNIIFPADPTNVVRRDNAIDLGYSAGRFDDIYATNGTIQTSDRNEKQDIEELSDAEQRVAVAAKGLLRKFRWKDSVAEKGAEARTHFGIIAQDLQAAFEAEGLDAGRYAMFISSTWTDEETGEERSRMGVRYSELLAFIIAAI